MIIQFNAVDMSNHQFLTSVCTKPKPSLLMVNTIFFIPTIEAAAAMTKIILLSEDLAMNVLQILSSITDICLYNLAYQQSSTLCSKVGVYHHLVDINFFIVI